MTHGEASPEETVETVKQAVRAERRVIHQLRRSLSLSRMQAVFGTAAALLSIGGALYGYLWPRTPPDIGEVVAVVHEARSGKVLPEATLELYTPQDALVTVLNTNATNGEARRRIKQGSYRLRVSVPNYSPQMRQIQVIGGETAEIRFRMQRPAPPPPPPPPPQHAAPKPAPKPNPVTESLKKIFR